MARVYVGTSNNPATDIFVQLAPGDAAPSVSEPDARAAVLVLHGRLGSTSEPLLFGESGADRPIVEALGGPDASVVLAVPVRRRGGKVGGILVLVSTGEAFAGTDGSGLSALARCAGTALDNADQLAAARRDQERLFLFAQATDEALWDWEIGPDLTWWGGGIQKLLGGGGREVEPRMRWKQERIHPADAERVTASLEAARESRVPSWREEYRFRRTDGSFAVVEDHGYFLRDERGCAFRMVGSLRDVTDLHRASLARQVLADASVLVGSPLDQATLLDRLVRLLVPELALGCAIGLVGGGEPDCIVAHGLPEAEPLVRALLHAQVDSPIPTSPYLAVPFALGARSQGLFVLVNAPTGCRAFDERDRGLAIALVDRLAVALENRCLFRALRASRGRLEVTLASIADGVITTDVQGRVDFLNAAAERLTGWSAGDAYGRPLGDVCCRGLPQGGAAGEDEVTTQPTRNDHATLVRRDGTRLLVVQSVAPIQERDGATHGEVLVFRDITERQQLEDERIRASKLESIGLLAGGIAHDFNNLLTGILTNVSLVERKLPADDPLRARLGAANAATRRASGLTRQLLTFSKGGAPVRTSITLPDLLRDTTCFSLQGSSSVPEFEIDPGLHAICGDSGQISQVVQNLVINASQAMPSGGRVRIVAHNVTLPDGSSTPLGAGAYVRVAVSDEGPGVPPDLLHRVFDPFFTTKDCGSGLGLATVFSIVRRHDGHVAVCGGAARGATFVFHLPAAPAPAALPTAAPPTEPVPRARVLVMDDDPGILAVAEAVLAEAGLDVTIARDGEGAIRLFEEARRTGRPFAAVLLDLTVRGGLGGRDTLAHLRRIDPNVRAIFSSGYSEALLPAQGVVGFVGVLPKPYAAEELTRAVVTALRGAPGAE
ncbi:MAG: PAS domain S-box protein [Pseudomonadota bacterium]|nr:PAS domain S-box protein [Pseudomonadota bacterium]